MITLNSASGTGIISTIAGAKGVMASTGPFSPNSFVKVSYSFDGATSGIYAGLVAYKGNFAQSIVFPSSNLKFEIINPDPYNQINIDVFASSAEAFSPLSLSPALWLSDTGSDVSIWSDISGNNRHATQATAGSRPAIITSALNGRQVRRFDGVDDLLSLTTGLGMLQNVPGATVIAVYKYITNSVNNKGVFVATNGIGASSSRTFFGSGFGTTKLACGGRRLDADVFGRLDSIDDSPTSYFVHTGVWDYANSNLFQYINGGANGQVTNFQTDGNTSDTPSIEITIGCPSSTAFTQCSNIDLAEILVFPTALSDADRQNVELYLGGKYGIPVVLDWRDVGPTYWPDYKASIDATIATGPTDPNAYVDGPLHGKGATAFAGGILTLDGKVILIPRNSVNIGIYDPVANTYTNGPAHGKGTSAFGGGATLAPNGKIILDSLNSTTIGIYDPVANTYTDGPTHGKGAGAFVGTILTPSGKVILIPHSSTNIGIYDPVANTYTDGPVHGKGIYAFVVGILTPGGKVIFIPHYSTNIGIYDPVANTYIDGPTHGKGTSAFAGGVLSPSGKVILVPFNSTNIAIYDPIANTYTDGPAHGKGASAFIGGVLTPSGKVILAPFNSTAIGIYDPVANTYTDGPTHGKGVSAFHGAVMISSGKIILIPLNSTNVGVFQGGTGAFNRNVSLSTYYNKL
jgi:hypothetical protein